MGDEWLVAALKCDVDDVFILWICWLWKQWDGSD
jgi:hypothetical protein